MNPTKKQKVMLDFIDGFVKSCGYSPTLREIMQALGYKSVSTVAKHVDNLIARGWLVKREGEARSLEVVTDHGTDLTPVSEAELKKHIAKLASKKLAEPEITDGDKDIIQKALELLGVNEEKRETT